MADWQWLIGPAAGGHDIPLPQPRQRKATFRLLPPHEASCQVNGRQLASGKLVPLAVDLHLIRDKAELFRGRIGSGGDDGDDGRMVTDVRAFCYRELLGRRRLYSGDTLTWTQVDQAEIAWQLVNNSQVRTGGQLGITKGVGNPTGFPRDRTYAVRDSIGEKVQELAEVQNGFNWDVTPDGASSLKLDIFHPQRGTDRGVVLEFGGLVTRYQRRVDVGAYANAVAVTGDSTVTPALNPEVREATDLAGRLEGRWDGVFGHDIKTQGSLADRADWQLDDAQVIPVTWTLTLRANAWGGPAHIWLGDTAQVVVYDGHLAVDAKYRVYELEVGLDDEGNETVVVQAGGPKPDFRRRAAKLFRRLTELERR